MEKTLQCMADYPRNEILKINKILRYINDILSKNVSACARACVCVC